mmetsp:Transcript_36485/g.114368  ORF Transcript_36485/g.114368 Transcript_36485/m.114368 type:complete len:257 (-) Transcript_36485:3033-3803(-)
MDTMMAEAGLLLQSAFTAAFIVQSVDLNSLVDRLAPLYGLGVLLLICVNATLVDSPQPSGSPKSRSSANAKAAAIAKPKAKAKAKAPKPKKGKKRIDLKIPADGGAGAGGGGNVTVVDFGGKFTMTREEGMDAFLKFQGVGYVARKALCAQRGIHTLTYDVDANSMRIQTNGLLPMDDTYVLGETTRTVLRKRDYDDVVTLENGALVTNKTRLDDNMSVIHTRTLSADKQQLTLNTVTTKADGTTAEQTQYFDRSE